ncbi:MAG: OmpA family protein, partial [Flavobacteriales bacterium]|nr:OmpA family protein [Flavobacteriales bacterium]
RTSTGEWGDPKNLGSHINTQGNEIFPYISSDFQMYFSSDLHLGFGGLDIYVCDWNPDGCGNPQNMGSPINSPKDDFGIVLDPDGRSGFFSSNRNVASKDDILYFEYSSNITIEGLVVNCETLQPISNAQVSVTGNDHFDDIKFSQANGSFEFTLPYRGTYQLLAEASGYNKNGSCVGMEIIEAEKLQEGDRVRVTLALTPEEYTEHSNAYVCGRIVNARYGNPLTDAHITVMNHCTGEMSEVKTDYSGAYFIPVDKECEYTVRASKENFQSLQTKFQPEINESSCHELNIGLQFLGEETPPLLSADVVVENGMILELFHIYFDLDKARIKEDAIPDLKTLLTILQKHPEMRGELMAHTDSRATDEYNLDLSQRRADAAMQWLINRGIDPLRLTAKGYGETQLKNMCEDGVECSEQQHLRNRRVEFLVTDVGRGIHEISMEKIEEE